MAKKLQLLIIIISVLTLTGCFGFFSSKKETEITSGKLFENQEIKIRYPPSWNEVVKFDDNFPENTIVAFQNNTAKNKFFANVNVRKHEISEGLSSKIFADKVIASEINALNQFKELERKEINLKKKGAKETSYLITFEAKGKKDDPTIKYVQTFLVSNKIGYIITGAMSPDEDKDVGSKIRLILRSFEVK